MSWKSDAVLLHVVVLGVSVEVLNENCRTKDLVCVCAAVVFRNAKGRVDWRLRVFGFPYPVFPRVYGRREKGEA